MPYFTNTLSWTHKTFQQFEAMGANQQCYNDIKDKTILSMTNKANLGLLL